MKYMGSKNRIAKEILPIMLEKRENRTWVEPFVGGANMIDKVQGKRIGADINPYLIYLKKLYYICNLIPGWIFRFHKLEAFIFINPNLAEIGRSRGLLCFTWLHVCISYNHH